MQLIWTDRNNKFPWDTDFEEGFIYKQPLNALELMMRDQSLIYVQYIIH